MKYAYITCQSNAFQYFVPECITSKVVLFKILRICMSYQLQQFWLKMVFFIIRIRSVNKLFKTK